MIGLVVVVVRTPVLKLAVAGFSPVDFPAYVPGQILVIEGMPDPG